MQTIETREKFIQGIFGIVKRKYALKKLYCRSKVSKIIHIFKILLIFYNLISSLHWQDSSLFDVKN